MKNVSRLIVATSVATLSLFGFAAIAPAQVSTTAPSSTTSTILKPVQILPITCENALTHGAWVSSQPKGKRRNAAAKSDCGKPKNTSTTTTSKAPAVAGSASSSTSTPSSTIAVVVIGSSTTTAPKPIVDEPGKSDDKRNDDKAKADEKAKSEDKAKGNSANAKGKAKK